MLLVFCVLGAEAGCQRDDTRRLRQVVSVTFMPMSLHGGPGGWFFNGQEAWKVFTFEDSWPLKKQLSGPSCNDNGMGRMSRHWKQTEPGSAERDELRQACRWQAAQKGCFFFVWVFLKTRAR